MTKGPDYAKGLFIFSLVGAAFAYGFVSGTRQLFPYFELQFAIDAVGQVWSERATLAATRPDHFLQPSVREGEGVTVLRGEASPGLTLIAGFFEDSNELRLVELDGTVVRRWPVAFSELFPSSAHLSRPPATDWNIDLHGALAMPDGSVVFNFEYGGLVRLDRCGGTTWTLEQETHHSVEPSERGGFWVAGRRLVEEPPLLRPYRAPYEEDFLLRVSPDGAVLAEISLPELLIDAGLAGLLTATGAYATNSVNTDRGYLGEIVHLNDIEELPASLAADFPGFEAGDLVVSLRHRNLLLVLDPEDGVVRWHGTGPWIRQHDPDFQPGGTITVVNNNTDEWGGQVFGGTNVMELDVRSGSVEVLEIASTGRPPYTPVKGKHQRLPNGNTLVVLYREGRIVEVDRRGEPVWEFINRYDEEAVAAVSDAVRYPPGYFEGVDWRCGA